MSRNTAWQVSNETLSHRRCWRIVHRGCLGGTVLVVVGDMTGILSTYDRIPEPKGGWRTASSFTDSERLKLRPVAETLAMLDGNAFFGMGDGEHYWADQYLPEAHALYEANGGDNGWAGEASFAKAYRS
jgi:hypothetical protein